MDITDCGLYSACGDCFIVYQANEREQHFYYLYPGYDTAAILASTPFYSNETSKTGAFVSVDTLEVKIRRNDAVAAVQRIFYDMAANVARCTGNKNRFHNCSSLTGSRS